MEEKKKLEDYEWLRVRYIGDFYKVSLTKNKEYNAMVSDPNWYAIYDDTEDYYAFPSEMFEVLGKGEPKVEHFRQSFEKNKDDPNDVIRYPDETV